MSNLNLIAESWKKEQAVFNKYLALLKLDPGKKTVHNIRVTIKKLRAILELYVILSEESLYDFPLKKTDHLFNIIGKQRDVEICLELLKTLEKETGYKFSEQKRYFLALFSLTLKASKKAVSTFNNNNELTALANLLRSESEAIHKNSKNKIKKNITTHLTACRKEFKKPHLLRQRLKEIYYWIKILPNDFKIKTTYVKNLRNVLDDFGNWQDLQVYVQRIRHFRKDYLTNTLEEFALTKKLEKTVIEKKEKLLKATLSKTNSLLKKIELFEKERSDSA